MRYYIVPRAKAKIRRAPKNEFSACSNAVRDAPAGWLRERLNPETSLPGLLRVPVPAHWTWPAGRSPWSIRPASFPPWAPLPVSFDNPPWRQSALRGFGGGGSLPVGCVDGGGAGGGGGALPVGCVEAGGSEAGNVSSTSWSSKDCSGSCEASFGRLTGPSASPPRFFTWALSMGVLLTRSVRESNHKVRGKFPLRTENAASGAG